MRLMCCSGVFFAIRSRRGGRNEVLVEMEEVA